MGLLWTQVTGRITASVWVDRVIVYHTLIVLRRHYVGQHAHCPYQEIYP